MPEPHRDTRAGSRRSPALGWVVPSGPKAHPSLSAVVRAWQNLVRVEDSEAQMGVGDILHRSKSRLAEPRAC